MNTFRLNLTLTLDEIASLNLAIKYRIKDVKSKIERFRKEEASLLGQSASKEEIKDVAEIADYYVKLLGVLDSLLEKVNNY